LADATPTPVVVVVVVVGHRSPADAHRLARLPAQFIFVGVGRPAPRRHVNAGPVDRRAAYTHSATPTPATPTGRHAHARRPPIDTGAASSPRHKAADDADDGRRRSRHKCRSR